MPDNLKTTKESQNEALQQLYHCPLSKVSRYHWTK
mgnify:CR=1 FL=1|nr:MAG TPA: hypothetical protein [Bacteriophage sp.]DAJ16885.1 MAG TPA: hypothetical protein [Caudovirales sp. ctMlE25]